jgi:hypothetical protein
MKVLSSEALQVVAAEARQVKAMQVVKEWMKPEVRWVTVQ